MSGRHRPKVPHLGGRVGVVHLLQPRFFFVAQTSLDPPRHLSNFSWSEIPPSVRHAVHHTSGMIINKECFA